ncbi:MAG: hypothetical protein KAY24_06000 [Candidatus Eisenbacteria sp.]|nr:hypothetical protein [Candidatus Eisenbacteria bacterium]
MTSARMGIIIGLMLGGATPASATIYMVMPDGTGDFPSIQAAIDTADSLDIIELADGTFTGPDNHNLDFRGQAITVRSKSGNPSTCIIDCEGRVRRHGQAERGFLFQSGEGSLSVVQGLAIKDGVPGGE